MPKSPLDTLSLPVLALYISISILGGQNAPWKMTTIKCTHEKKYSFVQPITMFSLLPSFHHTYLSCNDYKWCKYRERYITCLHETHSKTKKKYFKEVGNNSFTLILRNMFVYTDEYWKSKSKQVSTHGHFTLKIIISEEAKLWKGFDEIPICFGRCLVEDQDSFQTIKTYFICKSNSIQFSLHCVADCEKGDTWKLIINVPFLRKSKHTYSFLHNTSPPSVPVSKLRIGKKKSFLSRQCMWNIQRLSTIERNFSSWSAFILHIYLHHIW